MNIEYVLDFDRTDGKVDQAMIEKCMADYAKMDITLNPYVEGNKTFGNYYLFLMDFLTYGEISN